MLRFYLFTAVIILSTGLTSAQVQPEDSAFIYREIQDVAVKRGFTKWIHRFIFRPLPSTASKTVKKERKKKTTDPYYRRYEHRVIRNIQITSLDPFGYKLNDTTVTPGDFFKKAGNSLHNRTAYAVIKHLLLFKEGDRFDSLLVRDSERIIRSQRFIRDVLFTFHIPGRDSVDIYIRTMDVWSMTVEGNYTTRVFSPDITERNFLGLGHRLEVQYTDYLTDTDNDLTLMYNVTNVRRSFVNAGVYHFRNSDGVRNSAIAFDRPFYSPYARWAGGVYFSLNEAPLGKAENGDELITKSFYKDGWAGHSFRIFKGNAAEDRSTGLILAIRGTNLHYIKHPGADTLNIYADENWLLTGLAISQRNYISDKYVFRFGDGEDIPTGKVYGVTAGYRFKGRSTDFYLGGRIAWGNYYPWGYFSASVEYGSFTNVKRFDEGVAKLRLMYFTELLDAGSWKFRQFITPSITVGINRKPADVILLNDDTGISGLNNDILKGQKRFTVTLQTQSYAPWNIIGFRFGPYLVYSAGMLSMESEPLFRSRVYSGIGFGLLIKNEYLVWNSLQISAAFYPIIPGNGNNVIKFNPVRTTDLGLMDFGYARPEAVQFK